MNKKLLAVALATAFAAPAMAEGVQIYGAFDVGVLTRGGGNGARDTYTSVSSGMNGYNFIGFKMSEDLGNGLTVAGDAQFGFNLDSTDSGAVGAATNGSTLRTITSTLALIGDHGVLVAGKTGGARAAWIKKYDPFNGFGAGRAQQGGEAHANNVVAWVTPEILPGLKGLAAYTTNLDAQDTPAAKQDSGALYAFAAMYDQGPISLVANYEVLKKQTALDTNYKVITAGASYDFGMFKVMGFYDKIVNLVNGWQVGVSAPVTSQMTLKAGYSKSTTDGVASSHTECNKWGVGGTYSLSKRTNLYADYGNFSDSGSGTCTLSTNGDSVGGTIGNDGYAGYGRWGADAGIRHTF